MRLLWKAAAMIRRWCRQSSPSLVSSGFLKAGTCPCAMAPPRNTAPAEAQNPIRTSNYSSSELDFADFCSVCSDVGPEDRRLRDDAHSLFDAGGGASKGAERNPSFLPQ